MPLTYFGNSSMGSGMGAVFTAPGFATCTYVPGGVYTLSVNTSVGTAFCSLAAPGDIHFSSDGSSVTCLYPGDDNKVVIQEGAPTFAITYSTPASVSEPATLVFPLSAYPTDSSPVTFASTYIASMTVTTFTGTAVAGGYFTSYQEDLEAFTR